MHRVILAQLGYSSHFSCEDTLDRLKLLVPLVVLLSPGLILVGLAQDQLTIDASKQPSPPARGRGPFPSSVSPGNSTHLPIRLELRIPSGPLQPDGTTLVDFVITNIGDDVILLPSSIKESDGPSAYLLTLWFTSDASRMRTSRTKRRAVQSRFKSFRPVRNSTAVSTTLTASSGLLRT